MKEKRQRPRVTSDRTEPTETVETEPATEVPATSNNEEKELDDMATMATVLDLWQRPLPKPLTVQDVLKVWSLP